MAMTKNFRAVLTGGVCALALTGLAAAQPRSFDVPEGDLRIALNAYVQQANVELIYPADEVRGHASPGVRGNLSSEDALERVLADTGFVALRDASGAIIVSSAQHQPEVAEREANLAPPSAPNSNPPAQARQNSARVQPRLSSANEQEGAEREVIVVTGSRIRGNPTIPLRTIDRDELEQSGQSDIGGFIRSLPEAFGGGANPNVMGASGSVMRNQNVTNASTVNLRGLGSNATLVLVNGRRLSADSFFQAADISGIPFDALERVEILKDGASAVYGSDAVAGVVNFILRTDFDGAVLRSRLGAATQGGGEEQTYSALLGRAGEGWRAMANVEYNNQRGVTADQRDFTEDMWAENTLLRPQERVSLIAAAGVDLPGSVSLSFEGLYSERSSSRVERAQPTGTRFWSEIDNTAYSAALTLEKRFENGWRAAMSGVTAESQNEYINNSGEFAYENVSRYVEFSADGSLGWILGRDIQIAAGGGYRQEEFLDLNRQTATVTRGGERHVSYVFAEALVPLFLPSETRQGLYTLDLSVSARHEDYSDFGNTTNPRVGLRYAPSPSLNVRATWGTSFKAPSFVQQHTQSLIYLFPASAFGSSQPGTGLMTWGGRPDLKPERSESWSAGIDFTPRSLPSLFVSATYFHIDYTDRIVQPVAGYGRALIDPVFAPFLILNPTAAVQQEHIDAAEAFHNLTGESYDPSAVVVIVENRETNATSQVVQGIDLAYRQSFDLRHGRLDAFANATWLDLEQQTSAVSDVQALTGTLNNAPDFKARVGASWSSGGWRATGAINYLNDSMDNITEPNVRISSSTTVDANLEYRFEDDGGWTSGLRLNLSATNLFDRDPPFVLGASRTMFGQYYDSTNTSPIGRVVHFQVAKSW